MPKVICDLQDCIWNKEDPPECNNEEIIIDTNEEGKMICRMFETVTRRDKDGK